MDILQTIFFTLIALGVLVSFHEFGHFWVARRCGVKVDEFSIGFGTPLLRWRMLRILNLLSPLCHWVAM